MSSSSGIHDPYWYEATVGQEYLIRMLDPNSGIESVTFQKTASSTLDDVVVTFRDGKYHCVQVKHSRTDTNLTFSNLFLSEKSSLFSELFFDWCKESSESETEIILFTNRDLGESDSTVEYKGQRLSVPSLKKCYNFLKSNNALVTDDEKISNFLIILKDELGNCSENQIIDFIKKFSISYSQPSLEEYKTKIQKMICEITGCTASGAELIHAKLDHELRKWATSVRGQNERVDREELLRVLSLLEDEEVGQHEIPPPTPFFLSRQKFSQQVEAKIKASQKRYFFVSGEAGSGKSSVVSYLCNRSSPAFDLRFHAFLPLQASGAVLPLDSEKTVTPKVFWTDLLIQLKKSLKGQLSVYNLPVISSSLTWEEVRKRVLECLESVAVNENRFVSIVVDGIDHAARSKMELTFLDTIPLPSNGNSRVKFILVGQPPIAYPQYPIWIREAREDVEIYNIPAIDIEDIEDLLLAKSELKIEQKDIKAIAVEIQSRVVGNTLSAVFAVEEAVQFSSLEEIKKCLSDRKLTGNLAEYYDGIWQATISKIPNNRELISVAVALVFSSFKTRATPEFMHEVFDELNVSVYEWINIFSNLGPLIIKDKLGYRVLHNDVRIYLIGFTNTNSELLSEVCRRIRNFLIKTDKFEKVRQNDLVNLILRSEDKSLLCDVVSDNFVFKGYLVDKPEDQIFDEFFSLLKAQLDGPLKTEYLFNSLLISKTIHSVDVSMSTFEIPKSSQVSFDGSYLQSECRVLPVESWDLEIIQDVLDNCKLLLQLSFVDRAIALFDRWFLLDLGLKFLKYFDDEEIYERWQRGDNKEFTREFTSLIKGLGYCAVCANRWDLLTLHPNLDSEENDQIFRALMFKGGLRAIERLKHDRYSFLKLMSLRRAYYLDDFESFLESQLRNQNWFSVAYVVKVFSRKKKEVSLDLMALLALSESALGLGDFYTNQLVNKDNLIELWNKEARREHPEKTLCYLSAIYGIVQKGRPVSGIVDDIITATRYRNHDEQTIINLRQLMYLSSLVSRSLIKSRRPGVYFDLDETTKLVSFIFEKSNLTHRGYIQDRNLILMMCMFCLSKGASNLSVDSYSSLRSTFVMMLKDNKYFWTKEWIISYLLINGEVKIVQDDLKIFFDEDSHFWGFDPGIRSGFLSFLEKTTFEFSELNFSEIKKKDRLGIFYPSSHKDYTLLELGETISTILYKTPDKWNSLGLKALAVSHYYDDLGDNRMHWSIKRSVMVAAIKSGASSFWQLLNVTYDGKRLFELNEPLVVETVINALQYADVSEKDLVFLWEYCRSILPYGEADTSEHLADLRDCFEAVASRGNYQQLKSYIAIDDWVRFVPSKKNNDSRLWFQILGEVCNTSAIDFAEISLDDLKELAKKFNEMESSDRNIFKDNLRNILSNLSKISKNERDMLVSYLRDLILSLRKDYSFRNSGLSDLFETLADLMSFEELEVFYKKFVSGFLDTDQPSYWSDLLRDDLRYFSIAFASKSSSEDILIQDLVDNAWDLLTSFGERNIEFKELELCSDEVLNWKDFYIKVIVLGMCCPYADFQLEAWKSFTRMSFIDNDVYSCLLREWDTLNNDFKVKLLGVLEVSRWSKTDFFNEFIKKVIPLSMRSSEDIEVRISSSICSYLEKKNNFLDFNFAYQVHEKFKSLPNGPDKLLDIDSEKMGLSYFSNEFSSFFTKLDMAEFIIEDIDRAEVERRVSRLRIGKVPMPENGFMRGRNSIILNLGDSLNLLHEAVEDMVASGEVVPYSNSAFFQFVLNGDDPSFLTFKDYFTLMEFDPDKFLNYMGMEQEEKNSVNKELLKFSTAFLENDDEVLAANINLFSNKNDIVFKYDLIKDVPLLYRRKQSRPSFFGGRGAMIDSEYRIEAPTPIDDPFFICEIGGVYKLNRLSFFAYPKIDFLNDLQLRSVDGSPFIFENTRGARLFYQRINLVGDVFYRSPYFRTSFIEQWVVNKQCILEMKENYKFNHVGVFRFRSEKFKN